MALIISKARGLFVVGREEIKKIEEIAQSSEVKGRENGIEVGLDRARSTARSTVG